MEERNKQWERERGKGLFFCHIVVWSFYSKNKRKGWVFMTMSILGLYQLFDNFDQRESGIIVTAYPKGLIQYMGLGLRRTDWYHWQSLIKRKNCYWDVDTKRLGNGICAIF